VGGEGSFSIILDTPNAEVVLSDFQLNPLAGDYDSDNDVDGNDFLRWQRGVSTDPLSPLDLQVWETNYGNVEPPLVASVVASSTSDLIDAALAYELSTEMSDDTAAMVADSIAADAPTANQSPLPGLSTSPPSSAGELDLAASNSSEAEDAEAKWLSDELLERVFG
jgi:hypothetical protein